MRDHHLAEIITFSSESKSRDNKISLGDQSYHSIGFEIDNTLGRVQTGPIEFSWKRQAFLSWEVLLWCTCGDIDLPRIGRSNIASPSLQYKYDGTRKYKYELHEFIVFIKIPSLISTIW